MSYVRDFLAPRGPLARLKTLKLLGLDLCMLRYLLLYLIEILAEVEL